MLQLDLNNYYTKAWECGQCHAQTKTLQRCSRCEQIRYCSSECQKLAWTTHKQFCQKPLLFTVGDGETRRIEDWNAGDRLPVIKMPTDGNPSTEVDSNVPIEGVIPIWEHLLKTGLISQEQAQMAQRAFEQSSQPSFALIRPFYISTKDGKDLYDKESHQRAIAMFSPLIDWKKSVNENASVPYRLTPVHTKRLDGAPI